MATADICFVSAGVYHYLAPESDVPRGGAQRQQHLLGERLRNRGHAVAFLVDDYGQPPEQYINGMLVASGCPEQLPTPLHAPAVASRFWAAMRRVDAAVYYVRGAPRLAILTAIGCRALGRPMVFCVANDADVRPEDLRARYGPIVRRLYRWMLGSTDAVVAQTERQQSLLRAEYGVESTRIPNGYDCPPAGALLDADEREFVLWLGTSDPDRKQPEAFLDLARRLPDHEFVMVSKPTGNEAYHEQLAADAREVENLRFVGGVPPEAVHDYYRRAQLLVNTSRTEGFPNTFLEAWRFETPIVSLSFDLDGLLADEVGGRYAGGPDQLATDVDRLVGAPDRRETLGRRGRELVENRYSLSRATDCYERILDRVSQCGDPRTRLDRPPDS